MPDPQQSPEPGRVWTWSADGRVYAVVLDRPSDALEWFDDVGSMCGYDGGARVQSMDTFMRQGAPFPHVPNRILREIEGSAQESNG